MAYIDPEPEVGQRLDDADYLNEKILGNIAFIAENVGTVNERQIAVGVAGTGFRGITLNKGEILVAIRGVVGKLTAPQDGRRYFLAVGINNTLEWISEEVYNARATIGGLL